MPLSLIQRVHVEIILVSSSLTLSLVLITQIKKPLPADNYLLKVMLNLFKLTIKAPERLKFTSLT